MDVTQLSPAPDGEAYMRRLDELRKAIAGDPAAGLNSLASHEQVLFASHVAALLAGVVTHSKAGPDAIEATLDLAAGRRSSNAALRGWLRTGAVGSVLRLIPDPKQSPGGTRELTMKLAADALAGRVQADRELLLVAVLERPDLASPDLHTLLDGVLAISAPSSERRRLARKILAHRSTDIALLGRAAGAVTQVEFSADRRDLLLAIIDPAAPRAGPTESVLLDVVKAAYEHLDYDDDREQVVLAAVRHPLSTHTVRQAVLAGLDRFKFPGPRSRVEAAFRPQR
jgi:hypothetical protein